MAKDYAKASHKTHSIATNGWRKRLFITVLLAVLLGVVMAGILGYQQYSNLLPMDALSKWITHIKSIMVKHSEIAASESVNKPNGHVAEVDAEPDIKFNFYNELPAMQVTIPDAGERAKKIEKTVTTSQQDLAPAVKKTKPTLAYIVQLGAYESESAASQVRISLLLSGIEVDIVQEKMNEKPVFRIQQGSYVSRAEADSALKALKKKGIDGIVKKIN